MTPPFRSCRPAAACAARRAAVAVILLVTGLRFQLPSVAATLDSSATAATDDSQAEVSEKPNVLMIVVDDLNDWVGFLSGHPQSGTPGIDSLAAAGRAFTNAHCVVPVCSPSRISVISGLHAVTHGSYELGPSYTDIPRLNDAPTMQSWFRRAGYEVVVGGKVLHHGFSGRLQDDIDRDLGLRGGGPRPAKPMNWQPKVWDWGEYPESDEEMNDYRLAQSAVDYLSEQHDRPFFLTVGFFRPHVPLYVPPHWFGPFSSDSLILPHVPADDLNDVPGNFTAMAHVAPRHSQVTSAGKWSELVRAYLAAVAFVDHCVGMTVSGLRNGPHQHNTIIVLWSDHGFHLGEKHHWAKRTLWEESTRVPLIIAGPGIRPGPPCREPVSLLDLYPTLVELCGLQGDIRLDGRSLTSQLENPEAERPGGVLTSSYEGNHAVRTKRFRYIRYADGAEELYDHQIDPGEHTNLADRPEHASLIRRLAAELPTDPAPEVLSRSERNRRAVQARRVQDESGPVDGQGECPEAGR